MKKLPVFLILFIIGIQSLHGQRVPSSCTAPDSIRAFYIEDSEKLAYRKIMRQELDCKDSIIIPKVHLDTVMNALLAVYNATSLPARDSVISIFRIQSFGPPLNSILISADTNLVWMKNLRSDVFPTGNSFIDSLISVYKFKVDSKDYWHRFFVLESEINYNLNPIIDNLKKIEGVSSVSSNGYGGDGNEITDSVYTDFVELIYSYGWGDCQSGCAYRRFWKFRVYYDCSVEFVESFGTPLDITSVHYVPSDVVSVFPNPFINTIIVKGISHEFHYTISNILGQKVQSGKSMDLINIDKSIQLSDKIYFLTIVYNKQLINFKLIKE